MSAREKSGKERPELFQVPKAERYLLSWNNVLFAVAFLAIGLPIWWKTTSVYRAWLPHADIAALESRRMIVMQQVEIISCDAWSSSSALSVLETELWSALAKDASASDFVEVRYQVTNEDPELLKSCAMPAFVALLPSYPNIIFFYRIYLIKNQSIAAWMVNYSLMICFAMLCNEKC